MTRMALASLPDVAKIEDEYAELVVMRRGMRLIDSQASAKLTRRPPKPFVSTVNLSLDCVTMSVRDLQMKVRDLQMKVRDLQM
jgi:hypothetical protein